MRRIKKKKEKKKEMDSTEKKGSAGGGGAKVFRIVSRTVPRGSVITGTDAREEDCFTEFTREHLEGMNIINMGVKLDHHEGPAMVGRVVDKHVTPGGSLLTWLELPVGVLGEGEEAEKMGKIRTEIIKMVQNGQLRDVSLTHHNTYTLSEDGKYLVVDKQPQEISLTPQGYREGSEILSWEFDDTPYASANSQPLFKSQNSSCKTVIDFVADELPDVIQASIRATNNKKKTKMSTATPTADDLKGLQQKNRELQAALELMKPRFDQSLAEEAEMRKKAKDEIAKAIPSIFDAGAEGLEMLKEGKSPEECEFIDERIAEFKARGASSGAMAEELLKPEPNDPGYNANLQHLQDMLANMGPAIVACARANRSAIERIKAQKKAILEGGSSLVNGAAGGKTRVASTAAGAKKRVQMRDFDHFMSVRDALAPKLVRVKTRDDDDEDDE